MKRYLFYGIIILMIILSGIFTANAADKNYKKSVILKLNKPTHSRDLAVGLLDMGKLIHGVLNDGRLSTWDYADIPCVDYKGHSYIPDLSMMIGVPEDPAWTPYTTDIEGNSILKGPSVSATFDQEDWGPKAGSFGNVHSGDLTYGDVNSAATTLADYPLMATSTFPLSWPKDADGHPFWPGLWAVDPNTGVISIDSIPATQFDFDNPTRPWKFCPTTEDTVLVGKFFSDKEIFFSMTDYDLDNMGIPYAQSGDTTQGYVLGLQLDISALSYGRSYAEDIIFFPMQIINNSPYDYRGIYVGFYNDSDIPTRPHDNLDWMKFYSTEYDAENDTTYQYNMSFIYDYRWGTGDFPSPDYKVVPAVKILETPTASQDIDFDNDGVIDVYAGEELGLTDWHWFEWGKRPGTVDNTRTERILYQLISGDNTDILPEEDDAYFHAAPDGTLDPHFDSIEGFEEMFPGGADCVFIMSAGPFDLASGDTTTFSFALVIGDDTTDVKFNARTAQFMYELNYQGADPPPAPTVTAVPGDRQVTLYWDDAAESAVDLMSGYSDFEGYKIYRSTSAPSNNEWGDKIYDGNGIEVGFVPITQFDLNNGISGLDSQYPNLNLGNNTGIVHKFVDDNLTNGKTYWYTVTAYDRGVSDDPELNPDGWSAMNYLETAKGNNPSAVANLVEVVPGRTPSNFVESDIKIEALAGTYDNHTLAVQILDQFVITGHPYLISFDDTSAANTTYSLKDEVTAEFLIENSSDIGGQESQIVDGMILTVQQHFSLVGFEPDSTEWFQGDLQTTGSANWQFSGTYLVEEPYDFEIRFTEEPDTAFFPPTLTIPFEIWNTTLNHKAKFAQFPPANPADTTDEMKDTWTSGDELTVQEIINGRPKFTIKMKLSAPPLQVVIDIDTTFVTADSMVFDTTTTITDTSVAPVTGDILQLITGKPFKGDRDFFRINTAAYTADAIDEENLDKVKVVPNPYIISAEWELDPNYKQLAFTNLPTVCDIHIYTLSGERVISFHHESETEGCEWWNLLSFNQQEIAYGCYIYVIEVPSGKKKIGKFVILR